MTLSNQTVQMYRDDFGSIYDFLNRSFLTGILREHGYYSESNIRLPRYFVGFFYMSNAWEYTLAITTINFVSFIVCCYWIYLCDIYLHNQ